MREGKGIALLPIGVFLVLYLGLGILFEYVMEIPMGFYNVPIVIAFLAAILVACLQNRALNFDQKLEIMAQGVGDKNICTIFISTRKCCFYAVFRYLSSDLLHFYSNFKPIFSVQLLLLFSFLLKRACINRLSLPMWSDLRVSALPVGLLHFHNTL